VGSGQIPDLVHVDQERLGVELVGHDVVELAGEVQLHAVGEVPAVVELQAQDGVTGLGDRGQDGGVRGRTRVGLHVGVGSVEEALHAVAGEVFGLIDGFAAGVVTAARVALGVLVGQHAAGGLQHGDRDEVLRRDHLQVGSFAFELFAEDRFDLRIGFGQWGIEEVGHRVSVPWVGSVTAYRRGRRTGKREGRVVRGRTRR